MTLSLSITPPQNPTFVGLASAETDAEGSFVRSHAETNLRLNVSNHPYSLAFGQDGFHGSRNGNTICLGENSSGFCQRSTDGGLTYTRILGPESSGRSFSHIGGGVWVAAVYNRARVERSIDDGATWSQVATSFTPNVVDFANGYLVLANAAGGTGGLISTDGSSWSACTFPFSVNLLKVVAGQMVVWGTGGTSIGIATSADCSTWNTFTAPANVQDIDYGNGKWIINASDNSLYQSADLVTWQKSTNVITAGTPSISFMPEYGLFFFADSAINAYYIGPDCMNLTMYGTPWAHRAGCIPTTGGSGGGAPYVMRNDSTYGFWTVEAPRQTVTTE